MPGSITAAAEVLYNIPPKHRRMNLLHKKAPFIFMNGDESNEVESGRKNRVTCRIPV